MDRNLARFQGRASKVAILLRILHRLVQHIVIALAADREFNQAACVTAGKDFHATVSLVGIIDRQPNSNRFCRREWPVAAVLMPINVLSIARQLAEEMRAPTDYILAQEIGDVTHDRRVVQNVPHLGML